MPLEPTTKCFYGPEARAPWKTTRNVFMDELRRVFNDPAGDYQPGIGKPVTVTPNETTADLLYDNESEEAIIYVVRGTRRESTSGREVAGTFYPGSRYEITLPLDFSMGAEADNPRVPAARSEADQDLADALEYFIKTHRAAFAALGLHNIELETDEERQLAGHGRNPHNVTFLAFTIDGYNPA